MKLSEMNQSQLEELQRKAQVTHDQLFWSVSKDVYNSWGVRGIGYSMFGVMPTLVLNVDALMHKGIVLVSLNESKDLYEVRLVRGIAGQVKITEVVTDIYSDELGSVIDSKIERPEWMTDEEYTRRSTADSVRKMISEE